VPREFLVATFTEERSLLQGVREIRARGFRIYDVYAPYPVHGLDAAMGLRRSRLPLITLAAGLMGLLSAAVLQFYTTVYDWPMNVGGKPNNSTLAFVPISFELTILFGGLATVAAFFLRCRLFPGARPLRFQEGTTDDTFALVLRRREPDFDATEAGQVLQSCGARNVRYVRQKEGAL
jgi:Protein of unknown function (DUF3341)